MSGEEALRPQLASNVYTATNWGVKKMFCKHLITVASLLHPDLLPVKRIPETED